MSDDEPASPPPSTEECGIGTVSMLFQSISALMTRCDAVTVTIRRAQHPALVEYTVRELASTTSKEQVDATSKQA